MPLAQTLQICADTLYNSKLTPPTFPKALFTQLLPSSTASVELSFNNTMNKQIVGVSMSSPLGPALIDIFVECYEKNCFGKLAARLVSPLR